MLTIGSLFSGIGGLDLGLERAGMTVKWQVEIDPYCRRVLAKHWPNVERFEDVRLVGAHNLARVDLICGGFPCQDISNAGKRAGIDGERSGLWSEFHRIICELRPQLVLVENVAALLVRGMGRVLGDLAESGYDAEWDCIPAAAVGAPHIRNRVFILAHAVVSRAGDRPRADRRSERKQAGSPEPTALRQTHWTTGAGRLDASGEDVADAPEPRERELPVRSRGPFKAQSNINWGGEELADTTIDGRIARRSSYTSKSSERREPDRSLVQGIFSHVDRESLGRIAESRGQRGEWATEPDVGRVAHGVPARVDRLRGLGNAVVPQVAEWIGRRIVEAMMAAEEGGR